MHLLIMQLSTAACHFLCLWFKYLIEPFVLKQPQSINFLITLSLDTLNPHPALNVTDYISKAYKQWANTNTHHTLAK